MLLYGDRKVLSYYSKPYCTVKAEKGAEIIHTELTGQCKDLGIQVLLSHSSTRKPSGLWFYWSNSYYTGVIVHQGMSNGAQGHSGLQRGQQ